MDCKDLMIGDWVICNHYQDKPFTKQFGVADFAKGEYEFCEPIPLTSDILEKNGFAKTWNGDWQLKEYSTIIISKDYYVDIFERSIKIDYVHELQHILHAACVDKELVIE